MHEKQPSQPLTPQDVAEIVQRVPGAYVIDGAGTIVGVGIIGETGDERTLVFEFPERIPEDPTLTDVLDFPTIEREEN